mgnify:CR=1 FL=1
MSGAPRFLRLLNINNAMDESLIGNTFKRQNKRLNRILMLPYLLSFVVGTFFVYKYPDQLNGVLIGSGLGVLVMVVESCMGERKLRYIMKRTVKVLRNQGYQWDIDVEQMINVMKPIWKYVYGR